MIMPSLSLNIRIVRSRVNRSDVLRESPQNRI